MIDIKLIRDDFDGVKKTLLARHAAGEAYARLADDIDRLADLDGQRRALLQKVEEMKQERNALSRDIGARKKSGEDTQPLQERVQQLKQAGEQSDAQLKTVDEELGGMILRIPNLPDATVPRGAGEEDNVVLRTWGSPTKFSFAPKQHFEIGESLGILDLERAARLAGARFSLLRGAGARLERALIDFMLDIHTKENGYTEIAPPYMVTADVMRGTGQLPKFEADLFKLAGELPLYLIPTAEVPLTNLCAGEILDAKDLPMRLAAFTPCFRSEAGSYGKDTRGILRVHQFDKVELVNITTPDTSNEALEQMTRSAEKVLQRLEIPYRVVALCTADMGFAAAKTYDIEVWLPGQDRYREISSCSNCTDFQARRMNARYRAANGKPQFVHTLNGSGIAVGRTWIALVENFQQEDGSVVIPPALRPYMGGIERITK